MAPRANWKGYFRLSLVSCPIALYPASSHSEKVSFNRGSMPFTTENMKLSHD
jgi:DNA end-binding protein Ku